MPGKTAQLKTQNPPKLRFAGFSGAWEEKKLGEVAKIIDGDRGVNYPNGDDFSNDGYCLFLNAKNVTKRGFSFDEKSFIRKEKDAQLRKGKLYRNDVVLTTRGSVGHVAFYNNQIPFENIRINSGMVLVREEKKDIEPDFLYKFLTSKKVQNKIQRISFGSAQPQLTVKEINNLKIEFPALPEQKKIADFLGAVDTWIENLRAQKENLESYKKGIMQKIFSQQIRFKDKKGKDFPKWEEKKLGDCLDYEQPTSYIVESTEYDDKYKIPVLTAGKTFILGYTDEEKGVFEADKLPVIIFDDFTTTSQFVDFPFKVKSSAMKILMPKNNTDIKFIYEAMQQVKYDIGGHGRHWISKYSKIKINLPSVAEQQKIADFLTSVDKVIESKQQQITQAETWKKGLMQGLFV